MGRVLDRLLAVLVEMVAEAKARNDRELLKEIAYWKIRLLRGSLKGKGRRVPLTYREKEEALIELFEERGWPTGGD
jgi:hypothetical protein